MADFAAKAQQYVAQGDKKLRSFGFFGNKYEEAADLYEKGANQYKLAKACERPAAGGRAGGRAVPSGAARPRLQGAEGALANVGRLTSTTAAQSTQQHPPLHSVGTEAGETFAKLADVHIKLESKHDAASCWVEASKAFLKVDQRRECGSADSRRAQAAALWRTGCRAVARTRTAAPTRTAAGWQAASFYHRSCRLAMAAGSLPAFPAACVAAASCKGGGLVRR